MPITIRRRLAPCTGWLQLDPQVTPRENRVLDDRHATIPDRPGNDRGDTLENLLANPASGLFFRIPGIDEVLPVNGQTRRRSAQSLS